MTAAQELEAKYSEVDLRVNNEAETFIADREKVGVKEIDARPEMISDFLAVVGTFSALNKDEIDQKLRDRPDDKKDAYMRQVFTKLLSESINAPDKLGELEKILDSANPQELETAMNEIMKKGAKTTVAVSMVVRLLKMFKGGAVISRIMDLEGRFGIKGLNESLSKLPPDVVAFLSKLSNRKLRVVDYVHLTPMLLKIMKNVGDEDTPGFLDFTQDLENVVIMESSNPTSTTIKDKKKKYIIRATTNLKRGCFENDLIVMSVSNPILFEHMTESIASILSEKKDGATAFGVDIKTFNKNILRLKEIGAALKQADDVLQKRQETYEQNEGPDGESQAASDERMMAHKSQAVRLQIQDIDTQLAPYEEKKKKGILTPVELEEMYRIQSERAKLVYRRNQYEMGVDRQNQESPWNPSEEKLMRQVATSFTRKREDIEKMISPEGKTKAQESDIRILTLAERFLLNNRNLDVFMKDYYMSTFYEERERYVNSLHAKAGRQLSASELHAKQIDIDQSAAKMTREVTELMLQNIIIQMYTTTVEAGGEPDMPFAQAVSIAKTQLGYNPKMLVNVISRVLTGYKTTAAQLSDTQQTAISGIFASPEIPHSNEARLRAGENKRAIHQRVDMVFGKTGADVKRFMNSLEREFEVFERVIEGSYTLRYRTNMADGKYYEHLLQEDAMYIKSDTFDIVHIMEDGDVASKYLPGLKAIMDDFFAERGWYLVQELEKDPLGHEITIFKVFKDYVEEYYPDLSENQQRKFTQIAFQQGYAHGYFQQMLSRTRMVGGFVGKVFDRKNALHNSHFQAYMFANSKASDMMDNKHWGRGTRVLPANYEKGDYWGPNDNPTGKVENIDHTIPYGAIIQFGTDNFGHFLKYTDEHFEKTEGKGMTPFNIFQTGSDDNYKGWRQINKSIGNVSTKLWDRAPYKDEVKLQSSYKNADHYTLVWKSVENIGINYVRSWIAPVVSVKFDAQNEIIDKNKLEHFMKFLYRRYFHEGLGHSLIVNKSRFANMTTEDGFWNAFESAAKKNPSKAPGVLDEVLYVAYTTMLAERNPLTLMNKVTKWTTQTGLTLFDKIRQSDHFKSFDEAKFRQVRRDLLTVQVEARGRVTEQIKEKRKDWESGPEHDRNIFGDFTQDRSSVSITGDPADKGYAINPATIEKLLRDKLSTDPRIPPEEVESRIRNAKLLYGDIMGNFSKKVDLPSFEAVGKYLKSQVSDTFKKSEPFLKLRDEVALRMKAEFAARGEPFDESTHGKIVDSETAKIFGEKLAKDHLGADATEFAAKYGSRLQTHGDWFMDLWKGGYFGMEPENDFAEYFTTYRNPDKDHLWRMAGMTEFTSVAIKKLLDDPDGPQSIEIAVKDFAKDPFGAVDKMADYLNPFRKVIENELGKEMAGRYVNYYSLMCIDMALKEDKFRSGPTKDGWAGVFRDFVESVSGGTRKQSAAADRYQNYTGISLTAAEANQLVKYMHKKKLVSPEGAKALRIRMKATIPDILWEKMPYLAIFLTIAILQEAIWKPGKEQLTGKKK